MRDPEKLAAWWASPKGKAAIARTRATASERKLWLTPESKARKRAYQKRNTEWLKIWKHAAGCVDCGYREDPSRLHFDHVRGEKLFELGQSACGRSRESVMAEIEKCEVRCVSCHRVRHEAEKREVHAEG